MSNATHRCACSRKKHPQMERCERCQALLQRIGDRAYVDCKFCGVPTPMLGTEQCDNCWEVHSRVGGMPRWVLNNILRSARQTT